MTNDIETKFKGETTIGGVKYRVSATLIYGRKTVKAMVERKLADGSVVWAHLSHRQASAERQAISRFAAEIEAAW